MYSLARAIDALKLRLLSFVGWLKWCTPKLLSFWAAKSRADCPKNTASWPVLGTGPDANLRQIAETQWSNDKEQKYILQLPFRKLHVLPAHYLNDYSGKPEHHISSNIDLRERLLGRWTLLGSMTPEAPGDRTHSAISFIKGPMTKNMESCFAYLHDETSRAIDEQIGDCSSWNSRSAYWLGVNINLQLFERVFVGPRLCRNFEWRQACLGYSTSAIASAAALMKYSWWQRPMVAPFLKEMRTLRKHIRGLRTILEPVLKARLDAIHDPDFKRPDDFVQWWVENAQAKRHDTHALTTALIQLNIAGIQSTGMVVMQALFDLAGRPEYMEPLRAEVQQVIAEHNDAALSPRAISKLVLMDSFLKESQRHVAQNILSVYRKAMAPLTLKDGTVLPAGSYVCVPSIDHEADPSTLSREWDGFRWARLREQPGNANKYTTVASGFDSLEFGHGSHACPGRFFAMNVVKATLAAIIRRYDLRFPDGEGNPVPKYNRILVLMPDKERQVEFFNRAHKE